MPLVKHTLTKQFTYKWITLLYYGKWVVRESFAPLASAQERQPPPTHTKEVPMRKNDGFVDNGPQFTPEQCASVKKALLWYTIAQVAFLVGLALYAWRV